MARTKKNPPSTGRLGNLILVDKKRLSKELSNSRKNVKSKEEIEATIDGLFGQMIRFNMGVK